VRGLVQLNVPGIEMWEWTYDGQLAVPFAQGTLAALAVLLGLRWLQARGLARAAAAGVVLTVAAVLALAGTFAAEHRTIAPRDTYLRELFTLRETIEEYPAAPVVLVVDRPLLLTGTAFQYWLGDRDYRLVDPAQEATKIEPGELVIGTLWPRPLMIGAQTRLVQVDPTARYAVWYAPDDRSDPPNR
jgi:hypothetical protein